MTIPQYITNIFKQIDLEFQKNRYKNLVFKGGGVRGIAYMGALEELDQLGIVKNIQRVAGASAGAITATLLSFNLSIEETKSLFDSLDITRVPQEMTVDRKIKFWESKDAESVNRFFTSYGWYSSKYFHSWLEGVIADQCDGNRRATFADFRERGFRNLFIVATNLSRHRAEVFSHKDTPDVAVADAVRMSMSIPIFFEALRFDGEKFGDGDYYVDGGLFDNFPMHIFDQGEYANRSWAYRDGVNWETLGLYLYPAQMNQETEPEIPENVWKFLTLALRNLYNAHLLSAYQNNPVDKHRTIEISDCGISSTEFDVVQGSEKFDLLYQSGQQAVRKFFEVEA